jgi:hypothetical protein
VKRARVRKPGEPDALTKTAQGRVERVAARRGVRDRAIIAVLLYAGARVEECERLNAEDVALTARTGPDDPGTSACTARATRSVPSRCRRSAASTWPPGWMSTPGAAGGSRETVGGDTGTAPAVLPDQTCRRELLDRTLMWNQHHLLHALREYETFYNQHRPHRTLEQAAPLRLLPEPTTDPDQLTRLDIRRQDRLSGTLHEYRHAA